MNTLSITILATGFVCLAIGLALYFWITRSKSSHEFFYTTHVICWILIALFPALIIFSFFPQSSITGNIFGFSMTGAVALFVFIWWYGNSSSQKAMQIDGLLGKIRGLEADLKKSQEIQQNGAKLNAPKVLVQTEVFQYALKKYRRKNIALVTGNIQGVKFADIWVNSENTNMQMSRFFEKSISGTIRYLGARKDDAGEVIEDLIMNEVAGIMKGRPSVQPATVLVTGSGQLKESHNVKKIFHVASVRGQVASGYQPIDNIELCVHNALGKAAGADLQIDPCKTILFPLIGTGQAKAKPEEVVGRLMTAALEYLESKESTPITTIYFLAWTDSDLKLCRSVLEAHGAFGGWKKVDA